MARVVIDHGRGGRKLGVKRTAVDIEKQKKTIRDKRNGDNNGSD